MVRTWGFVWLACLAIGCITTLTVNAHRAYNIAREFRKRGIKVVMGGPHVSALPDEARQHCDAVAIGNGEATMSRIVADLEAGCLQASYSNAEPSQIPEHVTGYSSSGWQTSVMASRGCELSCDFCSMQNIFGKFYIQRDPASTIEDVRRVKTPIGLDIGADTPAEIAVSVVAELIKVRRLGGAG